MQRRDIIYGSPTSFPWIITIASSLISLLLPFPPAVCSQHNSQRNHDNTRSKQCYSSLKPSAAAAAAKSLQSCPTLCDPIDGSPPGSPVYFLLILWVQVCYTSCSGPTPVRSDFSLPTMLLLPFSVLTTLAFVVFSPHLCPCHTPRSEPFLVMFPLPP